MPVVIGNGVCLLVPAQAEIQHQVVEHSPSKFRVKRILCPVSPLIDFQQPVARVVENLIEWCTDGFLRPVPVLGVEVFQVGAESPHPVIVQDPAPVLPDFIDSQVALVVEIARDDAGQAHFAPAAVGNIGGGYDRVAVHRGSPLGPPSEPANPVLVPRVGDFTLLWPPQPYFIVRKQYVAAYLRARAKVPARVHQKIVEIRVARFRVDDVDDQVEIPPSSRE